MTKIFKQLGRHWAVQHFDDIIICQSLHAPFNVYGLVHKFLYYIIQKNCAMYNRIRAKSIRNLAKQNKNRPARGAQGG